ncbi:hypothetical protein [Nostoc sp.]|uniref:hypothetical protein n=1 Tax=Nostoc sp. TaxID=1180 RepID=UPI002FFB1F33
MLKFQPNAFFHALNGDLVAIHKTPDASILQQFKGQGRRSPPQMQDGQQSEPLAVGWGASTKSRTVGGLPLQVIYIGYGDLYS